MRPCSGHAHQHVATLAHQTPQPRALAAEQQRARLRPIPRRVVDSRFRRCADRPDAALLQLFDEPRDVRDARHRDVFERARRRLRHRFRQPRRASLRDEDGVRPRAFRRPDNRAEVARVFDAVEHDRERRRLPSRCARRAHRAVHPPDGNAPPLSSQRRPDDLPPPPFAATPRAARAAQACSPPVPARTIRADAIRARPPRPSRARTDASPPAALRAPAARRTPAPHSTTTAADIKRSRFDGVCEGRFVEVWPGSFDDGDDNDGDGDERRPAGSASRWRGWWR